MTFLNHKNNETVINSNYTLNRENAAYKTEIQGWACVHCHKFYGSKPHAEEIAKNCCYTSAPCPDCETGRRNRHRLRCEECAHKFLIKKWTETPQKEWDLKSPVTTLDGDEYFFDSDEVLEHCSENNLKPSDLFLIHCVENNPPYFNMSEYVGDYLPEEIDDLPGDKKEMQAAEKAVNDWISKNTPFSWYPDYKNRISDKDLKKLDEEFNHENSEK